MTGALNLVAEILDEIDQKQPGVAIEQIEATLLLVLSPEQLSALFFAVLHALPDDQHERIMEAVVQNHLGHPPTPAFLGAVQEAHTWARLLHERGRCIYMMALWASMCARERNDFLVWATGGRDAA